MENISLTNSPYSVGPVWQVSATGRCTLLEIVVTDSVCPEIVSLLKLHTDHLVVCEIANSRSKALEWGLKFCIPNKLLGKTDGAVL